MKHLSTVAFPPEEIMSKSGLVSVRSESLFDCMIPWEWVRLAWVAPQRIVSFLVSRCSGDEREQARHPTPATLLQHVDPCPPFYPSYCSNQPLHIHPFSEHDFVPLDKISGCWETVMKHEVHETDWFSFVDGEEDTGMLHEEDEGAGWYVVGHAAKEIGCL
ncbi:hypothetical protein HDU98_011650 [Podochytrium sp. JEL0797]|nr:hypothetical protein HDU98_011650 [Podochytrium sp. JEL0797]